MKKIKCKYDYGYALTVGKIYDCIEYIEEVYENNLGGFTWPAYVVFIDDFNKRCMAHASRFEILEEVEKCEQSK